MGAFQDVYNYKTDQKKDKTRIHKPNLFYTENQL